MLSIMKACKGEKVQMGIEVLAVLDDKRVMLISFPYSLTLKNYRRTAKNNIYCSCYDVIWFNPT